MVTIYGSKSNHLQLPGRHGGRKEAVDSGADTVEEVQGITGAGTVCGACLEEVEKLVKSLVAQRNAGQSS